jgi:hypothetical protein
MKIGVCLIGDMVLANRDWNRTMTGFFDNLINCWKENDEVYIYICSNYIPEHVLDFFSIQRNNLTTLKEFINLHEERYLTFEKEYNRLDMW